MSEYVLRIAGTEYRAEVAEITPEQARIVVNDTLYEVDLVHIGRREMAVPELPTAVVTAAKSTPPEVARPAAGRGAVCAPLPGLILAVKVKEGDNVQAGQPTLVMEAMKMENVVSAPHNGVVRKIFVGAGDSVGEGDPLLEISRPEMTTL